MTTEFDNRGQSVWSDKLPGLQLGWDPTSVRAYMECPRKYYYGIIKGLRLTKANDLHLRFGKYWHSGLEFYCKARWAGVDKEPALMLAVKHLLTITWIKGEGPWESGDNNKNRWTLVRALVWMVDEQDPAALETVTLPNGEPAVELSLDIPLSGPANKATTGEVFRLSARIDRIATMGPVADPDSECWAVEQKTTKKTINNMYFDQFDPDPQTDQYDAMVATLMEELDRPVKGVAIEALQAAVEFNRVHRQFLHRSRSQRTEAIERVLNVAHSANRDALRAWQDHPKTPERAYEMRVTSCHAKGRCPFWSVCKAPPERRWLALSANYTERGPWEPFQREERDDD